MFSFGYIVLLVLVLSQAVLIVCSAYACVGLSRRHQSVMRFMTELSLHNRSKRVIPAFRAKSITSARIVDQADLSVGSCAIVFLDPDSSGPLLARDLNDLKTFVLPNVKGSVYVACSGKSKSELARDGTRGDSRIELLCDAEGLIAKAFGVIRYPSLVVIGEGGMILGAGYLPRLRLMPEADVDAVGKIRQLEREVLL